MSVTLVRWPGEKGRRARLAAAGQPRLLLVEDGALPPEPGDCLEDWIRVSAPDQDVRSRLDWLAVRASLHVRLLPVVDGDGLLRYREGWVSLPPVEARLTRVLADRFGTVVGRDTLSRAAWPAGAPGRNALDVHVLRLRRRVGDLGLAIRTVRSRGYLLEAVAGILGMGDGG